MNRILSDEDLETLWRLSRTISVNRADYMVPYAFSREIEAAILKKLAVQGEPVAWMYKGDISYDRYTNLPGAVPLYTAPQPAVRGDLVVPGGGDGLATPFVLSQPAVQEPLSDAQIARHTMRAKDVPGDCEVMLVSSIQKLRQAAHGITGEKP